MNVHQVNTLPSILEADSLYFVTPDANGNSETYITDNAGVARNVGNTSFTNLLIASALSQLDVNDVNGLQAILDGKSSLSHNHSISEVENLQSELDNKVTIGQKTLLPLDLRKSLTAYEVEVNTANDMADRRGDLWKFISALGILAQDLWDVYDFRNDGNLNTGDTWKGLLGHDFSKHSVGSIIRGVNGITFPSNACLTFDDSNDALEFETMAPNGISTFVCCKPGPGSRYVFGNGGTSAARGGGIEYYWDSDSAHGLIFGTRSESNEQDTLSADGYPSFEVIGLTYDGTLGRKTLWRGGQIYGQSEDTVHEWGTTHRQPALGAQVSEGGSIVRPFTGGEVTSLVIFKRELTYDEALLVQLAQRKYLSNLESRYVLFEGHSFVRGINNTNGEWQQIYDHNWQRLLMESTEWQDKASWHSIGQSSDRSDYMLMRDDQAQADRYKVGDLVDKLDVFLWIGINDIFYGKTAQECFDDTKTLIIYYHSLGARVHVMLGTSRNDSNTGQDPTLNNTEINTRIQAFNALMLADADVVAMTTGLFDWYNDLTAASGYTDGLHLTTTITPPASISGEQWVANELENNINP